MIPLNEFIQLEEEIQMVVEGSQPFFTDEQIEAAEFYNIKWNPVSGMTEVYIYDANGEGLGSVDFEDADVAIAFIEDVFDLEEDDLLDLDSYAWADDYDDRLYNTMQDDGTSDVVVD